MGVFVNFSNHPSAGWEKKQWICAQRYGEIIDVPFPYVNVETSEKEIELLGEECVSRIVELQPTVVMCQGEFTLTYYVVNRLKEKGITCVAACTERLVNEITLDDGSVRKESLFLFKVFREYV